MRALFQILDKGSKGSVNSAELRAALQSLGRDVNTEDIDRFISKIDADGNGEVDFNEFVNGIDEFVQLNKRQDSSSRLGLSQEELETYKKVFQIADTSGNGLIDFGEFRTLIEKLGKNLPEHLCKRLFNEMDSDGSGEIDFEEFAKGVAKLDHLAEEISSDSAKRSYQSSLDDTTMKIISENNKLRARVEALQSQLGYVERMLNEQKRKMEIKEKEMSLLRKKEKAMALSPDAQREKQQLENQIEEYKKRLEAAQTKISDLLNNNRELEQRIDEMSEIDNFEEEVERRNERSKLLSKNEALSKANQRLDQELSSLKKIAQESEQNSLLVLQYQREIQQLSLEREALLNENEFLNTKTSRIDEPLSVELAGSGIGQEIQELQAKYDELQSQLDLEKKKLHKEKKKSQDQSQKLEANEKLIQSLKSQLQESENKVAQYLNDIKELFEIQEVFEATIQENEANKQQVSELTLKTEEITKESQLKDKKIHALKKIEKEKKELSENFEKTTNNMESLQSQIEDLTKEKTDLETTVVAKNSEIASLQESIEQEKKKNSEMIKLMEESSEQGSEVLLKTTKEKQEIEKEKEIALKEIIILKNEKQSLESQRSESSLLITDLQSELEKLKKEKFEVLLPEIERLKKRIEELELLLKEKQEKASKLQEEKRESLEQFQIEKKALEEETMELKKKSSSLESKLNLLVPENEELKNQIASLRKEISESKQSLEQINEKTSSEHSLLQKKLESIENEQKQKEIEITELKQRNGQLIPENDQLKTKISTLEIDLIKQKEEMENLRRKYETELLDLQLKQKQETEGEIEKIIASMIKGCGDSELGEEQQCYIDYINSIMSNQDGQQDTQPSTKFPIGYSYKEIALACFDGVLICKLINHTVPNTVDMRVVIQKPVSKSDLDCNHSLTENSAAAIGCEEAMHFSNSILRGQIPIVMKLIAEIIKIGLMSRITLSHHPELVQLQERGEDFPKFLTLLPEKLLLRWMNYQLHVIGELPITNYGIDLKDGTKLFGLLRILSNDSISNDADYDTPEKKAEYIIKNSLSVGTIPLTKSTNIVLSHDLPIQLLCAQLLHYRINLQQIQKDQQESIAKALKALDLEGTREERVFCNWMTSIGVPVRSLVTDLSDGIALLKVLEIIHPHIVDWKKTVPRSDRMNKFNKVQNCNYAVEVSKNRCGYVIVNLSGEDICEGNRKLILGLVWQMMRDHVLTVLSKLNEAKGGTISEPEIQEWACSMVKRSGKMSQMKDFRDQSLKDSKFLIDLLNAILPGCVSYGFLAEGKNDEEIIANAKYAITVARKIGACVFITHEDIIEVKDKQLMIFVATLMSVYFDKYKKR
eukprot:TRINITY_DN11760_c0_g1_i1.p1 TRINITY_DN11760_c0_g1~~TRINITY_DN11760_c0_g1_i1.p1  ORF type:complete len:1340 (+),score=528.49 TRINITY_DN11760_c0_g1_i1:1-4020(+)